jgi:hypothetical protein
MSAVKQIATPTVVATTTHELKLKPAARQKLLTKLRSYQALHAHKKMIEADMDKLKAEVGILRNETGEQSIEIDGFRVTLVAPTRKKFNPKLYVKLGGDLDIYNQANEETLVAPYEKISLPSSGTEDAE